MAHDCTSTDKDKDKNKDTYILIDQRNNNQLKLRDGLIIGRSSKCDIIVKDVDISSKHIKVCLEEDGCYIIDLHSFNGTRINSQKIPAQTKYKLNTGDTLEIGKIKYILSKKQGTGSVDASSVQISYPNSSSSDDTQDITLTMQTKVQLQSQSQSQFQHQHIEEAIKKEPSINTTTDIDIGNFFEGIKKSNREKSTLPLYEQIKVDLHEQELKLVKLKDIKCKLEFFVSERNKLIDRLQKKEMEYKRKNHHVMSVDLYNLYVVEMEELERVISKAVQRSNSLKHKIDEYNEVKTLFNEILLLKEEIRKANHSEAEVEKLNAEIDDMTEMCSDLQRKYLKEKQTFEKNEKEERENKRKRLEEEISRLKEELNKIA
ncbi:MAG: FHA domain-containing protein [Oligoflexia bacterium]|nr:FHA domain-containing protein [Oligoflexia bacterium]